MTATLVEVQGTLQADGTLVLDQKPNLPPGRVRVTVQSLAAATLQDILQVLAKIRADQDARSYVPRSAKDIDADIAATRRDDEDYMLQMDRIREECERFRQRSEGAGNPM